MNMVGGLSAFARAHDKFFALTTRLSRIRRLFSAVHRPATFSPDKWITASNPDTSDGEISRIGSHCKSFTFLLGCRTRRTTSYPPDSSDAISADPINPEAPLIRTRAIAKNSTSPLTTWGQPPSAVPTGCKPYSSGIWSTLDCVTWKSGAFRAAYSNARNKRGAESAALPRPRLSAGRKPSIHPIPI